MKFKVTMKDPDTLCDAINEAVAKSVADIAELSEKEQEAVRETRSEMANVVCAKWFEYGEYLTVEIDTDAKTAVVVPVRESRG